MSNPKQPRRADEGAHKPENRDEEKHGSKNDKEKTTKKTVKEKKKSKKQESTNQTEELTTRTSVGSASNRVMKVPPNKESPKEGLTPTGGPAEETKTSQGEETRSVNDAKSDSRRPPNRQKQQQQHDGPQGSHPFQVDDSDHCETPLRAYQDLQAILDRIVLQQKKSRSSLKIYDPYYCDGGVKTKLASMGFTNVINENRDFYKDIETRSVPDYDVLVTNPPYSGQHMDKLLRFVVSKDNHHKPSFLLLPHFVYTKDYYSRALSSSSSAGNSNGSNSFFSFLIPKIRYSYVPPAWVAHRSGASKALTKGKETTAPFPSFWYCNSQAIGVDASRKWLEDTFGRSGSVVSKHTSSGLRYAAIPRDIPRDFKGEFDPNNKRPNPRARKRMRKVAAAEPLQRQRQRDPKKKKKKRY